MNFKVEVGDKVVTLIADHVQNVPKGLVAVITKIYPSENSFPFLVELHASSLDNVYGKRYVLYKSNDVAYYNNGLDRVLAELE